MIGRAMVMPAVAATAWAAAAAAVLLPAAAGILAVVGGICAAASIVLILRRPGPLLVAAALAAAAAAASASTVAWALPSRERAAETTFGGGQVAIVAVVTGSADRTEAGEMWFDASARWLANRSSTVTEAVPVRLALARGDAPPLGAVIRLAGDGWAARAGERAAIVVQAEGEAEILAPPAGVWAALDEMRGALADAASALPGPGAGLVPGLAVGDTSAVSSAVVEDMRGASLTHLTAVSGANCAIVVGIAFGLAAVCGASRIVRVVAGVTTLALFVLLVTPEPSVVRAAAMAAIAMVAWGVGRPVVGLAVLSGSVTVLLAADPWLALSLGFALSVVATGSLLVLARPLTRGLRRVLPEPLAVAISVPMAAQLACGPLLVLVDPAVPLLGVVANLLAAPAAPVATVVGFFACLAAPIPPLQMVLVTLAWIPASWIGAVAEVIAGIPGQRVPWPAGAVGAVALAAVGAAVILVIAARPRWRVLRGIATVIVCTTVGVAGGQAALVSVAAPWTVPSAWQIALCDVGQGDAVLLRSADAVALVDTGPADAPLRACLDRFGVGQIDLLVLTHFDADHAGGLSAVTGRVRTVVHGPPDRDGARGLAMLREAGAAVHPVVAGDTGSFGAAQWQVLWPARSVDTPGNDASVTLRVRGPRMPTVLLLGDLSAEPQARIRSAAVALGADVVKVAHHGSADQDPALYTGLAPHLALIPVGAGNDYGHPRASLLALLRSAGALIARTDQDGAIAVWQEGEVTKVWRDRGVGASD